ncbi:MAG: EamA/RhaT family transporter, partial [Spirochaetota bacterium]
MPEPGSTAGRPSHASLGLLAAGFVVLWNSGFIGAEFGLPYSGPFTLLFWRYLALTAVTAIIALARGELRRLRAHTVGRVAIVGVLSHGVWLSCVLVPINRGV